MYPGDAVYVFSLIKSFCKQNTGVSCGFDGREGSWGKFNL